MSGLTVSGIAIPISFSVQRPRIDLIDRARALDGTYKASSTGNAKRDWMFTTPPISRQTADMYHSILSSTSALSCAGDILGGSSNLLLHSEEFDNAVWTLTGATIGADAFAGLDGTTSADKLKEDASVGTHVVVQSVTCASTTYTFSVWVLAVERTKCVVSMSDNVAGNAAVGVDLSTGLTFATGLGVGSWTSITSTVTAWAGGWYRISVTGTRGAGVVTLSQVWAWTTAISYAGVANSGIDLWGAQLEAASAATSYTKTTSVGVSTLTTSCFPEITGWTPVGTPGSHYVQLSFNLHEA